jgi:hypothetical protein
MKLKEHLKNIQKLIKENPEAEDYEVISSIDDEGNGYNRVHFIPTIGIYDKNVNEFIPTSQVDEWDREESEVNSVCIN